MRHRKRLKKLGLSKDHRESLLKNLIASLVIHGRIRTTKSRAKALAARFDRMMRLVQKRDSREAMRIMPGFCPAEMKEVAKKVANELKKKYETRSSGLTRITAVSQRKGDNAKLVQIELI
ncbi:50S ribosomal protein L17 [Candidatus Peregrinibacteria bacterium]|nr:50S ribosomal protein L17 [Candidatus Peregrinibacteria bacterium]